MMQRVLNKLKSETARLFVRNRREISVPGGIVSFTFDDFPRNAYTEGGAILASHQAGGTYYVAMGLVDTENHFGRHFSKEDLPRMIDEGHELGCHTFGHLDCRESDGATVAAEISRNAAALEQVLPSYSFRTFAYPFGRFALPAKKRLAPRFEACRTIKSGINAGMVDFNLLRSTSLYTGGRDLDEVSALIRRNHEIGGWLIFYTHDVAEQPSRYGCTPDYFETVVRAAAGSGSQVLTVGAALDELRT